MKFHAYADGQGSRSEIVEQRAAILGAIGTMQQILCSVSIFLCNNDYLPVRGVELQNTQKLFFGNH